MNLCMRFGNFLCRKLDRDLLLIWCDRLHMFVRKYKTKNYIIHPKLRFKKVCFDFWLLFLVFKNVRKGYRFNSSVKSLIFSTKKNIKTPRSQFDHRFKNFHKYRFYNQMEVLRNRFKPENKIHFPLKPEAWG